MVTVVHFSLATIDTIRRRKSVIHICTLMCRLVVVAIFISQPSFSLSRRTTTSIFIHRKSHRCELYTYIYVYRVSARKQMREYSILSVMFSLSDSLLSLSVFTSGYSWEAHAISHSHFHVSTIFHK